MKAKRGSGTWRVLRDGRIAWRGPVVQPDGSMKQIDVSGKTRKAVQEKLAQRRKALAPVTGPINSHTTTTRDYLRWWLDTVVAEASDPKTHDAYDLQLSRIMPFIGRVKVADLSTKHVQDAVKAMRSAVNADGQPYAWSSSTIRRSVDVLRNAWNALIASGTVAQNPAKGIKIAPSAPHEPTILTADQVLAIEAAARDTRYAPAVFLITRLGLRLSEALGVQCGDLDFARGRIHLRHAITEIRGGLQYGTAKHRRGKAHDVLPLPQSLVTDLQVWHLRAKAAQLAHGGAWRDYDLLTPSTVGTGITPTNFIRWWRDTLMPAAHLPRTVTRHDVRHSFLTLLVLAGEDPKTVQRIARHSDVRTTLTYYVHTDDDSIAAALERHDQRKRG